MATAGCAEEVIRSDERLLRFRSLPALMWLLRRERRGKVATELAVLREAYRQLYESLASDAGGVIVDSSKLLPYALVLAGDPSLDVRFIHLVRDPRGAAFSWSKRIDRIDGGDDERVMGREGPLRSGLVWLLWNGLTPWLLPKDRLVTVRYEDFTDDPVRIVTNIAAWAGLAERAPAITGRDVSLGTSHTVAGNPSRMQTGVVTLQRDEHWRTKMPPGNKALVTLATLPLLHRLRYPLRPGKVGPL